MVNRNFPTFRSMSGLKKLGFFSAFIIPALVVAGYYLGPWGVWLPVVFVFLVIPVIDYLSGLDTTNVPENDKKIVGEEFYYRLATYLWTYVQFAVFIWAAWSLRSARSARPSRGSASPSVLHSSRAASALP